MDEDELFMLPVDYQGDELEFETRLVFSGYTQRFEVFIGDIPVIYEPDEEMNYRAMVSPEVLDKKDSSLTYGLLEAISNQINTLMQSR